MTDKWGCHQYQCGECGEFFTVKENQEYADDPRTRRCLLCGKGAGNISYLGWRGAVPSVRGDSIDPIRGVDGRVRDSKSAYYKHLKDSKCHIVDYEQKPRTTLEGDFKPTKELKEAVQKHLNEPTKRKKR